MPSKLRHLRHLGSLLLLRGTFGPHNDCFAGLHMLNRECWPRYALAAGHSVDQESGALGLRKRQEVSRLLHVALFDSQPNERTHQRFFILLTSLARAEPGGPNNTPTASKQSLRPVPTSVLFDGAQVTIDHHIRLSNRSRVRSCGCGNLIATLSSMRPRVFGSCVDDQPSWNKTEALQQVP